MGVFDDDDDEDIVADWDAFDAVVAQHQQKKQVLGQALPQQWTGLKHASCMRMSMLDSISC